MESPETPYYSPAWTKERAETEFYKRMSFKFDGQGCPCWHGPSIKTWFDAMQEEVRFKNTETV